jgi:hypothetical protein
MLAVSTIVALFSHVKFTPALAAVIAAGVAATVNVLGFGVAHALTVQRERRSYRREKVGAVIDRAALALYVDVDGAAVEDASPGSFAAAVPKAAEVMMRGFPRYTDLAVTLGDDHPLCASYMDAVKATANLEVEMERSLRLARARGGPDDASIDAAAHAILKAKDLRTAWTRDARRYVTKI